MRQIVVGTFERHAIARRAAQQLRESGFGDSVFVTDEISNAADQGVPTKNSDAGDVLAHLRQFFRGHFVGDADAETRTYAQALQDGGAIVKVEVDADADVERAYRALEAAGAVDIDERKGGVRVYPHAAARSKKETVEADSARADVQPRTGDWPATVADMKDIDQRTVGVTKTYSRSDFRAHFDANFAQAGAQWDDYETAYRYGSQAKSDARYRGGKWEEVQHRLRGEWESRDLGPWDKFKDAIRHAWEL